MIEERSYHVSSKVKSYALEGNPVSTQMHTHFQAHAEKYDMSN